eukprot:6203622-Pleurochrysis_carterae.AAC.2
MRCNAEHAWPARECVKSYKQEPAQAQARAQEPNCGLLNCTPVFSSTRAPRALLSARDVSRALQHENCVGRLTPHHEPDPSQQSYVTAPCFDIFTPETAWTNCAELGTLVRALLRGRFARMSSGRAENVR